MKRIGIIAALPAELKPLVQRWHQTRALPGEGTWQTSLDGWQFVAVCCGMGSESAQRACEIAASSGPLHALISLGWAGALSCGMRTGEAYEFNEVIDAPSGDRLPTQSPPRGAQAGPLRIVTTDHVATPAEKRRLGETFQAVMVDMEAFTVGTFARRHGSAFYCLKAVSDAAGERLPDVSQFIDHQGKLRFSTFLPYVAVHPGYWPGLARVGRNSRSGAQALATALQSFLAKLTAQGTAEVYT
jgi:adenosylhomocysteine nucleosidase